MPQLNPAPWLTIFILAWTVFMFIFLGKSLASIHQNAPSTKQVKETLLLSWNWPWH